MLKLCRNREEPSSTFKQIFPEELIAIAEENPNVVAFDADLANASGLREFADRYPERFFECGIQEANMAGTAAASSEAGLIPFAHTFAAFAARKCIDQVFLAGCYAQLDLKLIGSDPGVTAATNGGSHQAMEDMGIFMGLPNITLLEPSDGVLFRFLLRQMAQRRGVFYLRSNRKETRWLYDEASTFELGKGNVLRDGTDVTLIASGIEVYEALDAAELLQDQGISARVVDMFCWRPIDRELIVRCAQETGAIVTAENHAVASGLGSAVANVVVQEYPVPMSFIGVNERFGEVGSIAFLQKKFCMDAQSIAAQALAVINRKHRV